MATSMTSETDPGAGDGTACSRHSVSSPHAGGAHFLMCDGTVRFVNENISSNPASYDPSYCEAWANTFGPGFVYQNLFFKDDGNTVGDF